MVQLPEKLTGKAWASPALTFFIINLAFVVACFSPVFTGLYEAWQTDEYSHGFLIPFLALLIGAHRLSEGKPALKPSWWGVAVLFAGAALLVISRLSAFEPPAHYGFVLSLVGLSLLYAGRQATVLLLPAFVYLLFAIPLPKLIYMNLSGELQLLSSTLGVMPIEWLGLSVFQEGNIIDLGGYKLQVVEACNGLRYLFPLMSFGFLLAFLFEDKMWKRVVLFLSTIPITIGMNALRIAIIGITVNFYGEKMAEGFLHDFEGWTIFGGCLLLLLLEIWILGRIGSPRGRLRWEYVGLAKGPFLTGSFRLTLPHFVGLALVALMAMVMLSGSLDERKEIIPKRPTFATFPLHFGDWKGRAESIEAKTLKTLDLTDYWMASYLKPEMGGSVNLYMAYYESQRTKASIHSPMNCLPGGGWQVASREIVPVQVSSDVSFPLTRLLIRKGEEALLVYYWFDQRGRIINEQYGAKFYLFVDSITMHRTDGALVRLTTPLLTGETEASAVARLDAFLAQAYPSIKTYIPGR